ncbi:MAG: GspE/PulE family protein [Candidatus Omnitrophota bacterium]|nr:GspE/PulE family protein [Candidatus Omnitrophota bacterium]
MRINKQKDKPEESAWQIAQSIISRAIEMGATDVHFEPDRDPSGKWISVRYRINGILKDIGKIENLSSGPESVINALKVASDMDPSQKRKGQDGRFNFKFGEKNLDLRVSSLPTIIGEKIVLRIIDKEKYVRKLEELGMSEEGLDIYRSFVSRPQGLILITGPVGCGKTTTLYSTLNKIQTREKSFYTIEDPVESKFSGVSQTQVDSEFGMTFSSGLRAILRQDSEVVMIGEIRDAETAQISLRASLAGCLIFSTLHAKDSAHTVIRLMDMGMEPYLIAETLSCIVAQRLVRLTCDLCKGKGCQYCNNSGFRRRTGIFEIMKVSETIKTLISKQASAEEINNVALAEGMVTLRDAGNRLVTKGLTLPSEIYRVLASEEE